ADDALDALRHHPGGEGAAVIGHVKDDPPGLVLLKTGFGGTATAAAPVATPRPPFSDSAGRGRFHARDPPPAHPDRFQAWAPAVGRFWPVRVETDFDVQVPDPAAAGADLVSPGGEPVRYGDRVDLLLVDEHDAYWVARHRLVERFTEPELLILDDELVAA